MTNEDAECRAEMCRMLSERVAELEAENERYREALEKIADGNYHPAVNGAIGSWEIARAALKGTGDGGAD